MSLNINKTDLKYLFRDFTDIGKPGTNTKISFLTDDQVYKWNPDRYNFYMQILDEVMNPDSKVVDTVLSIENRTRRGREKIIENIRNVASTIGYLDARQRFIDKKQSGGGAIDDLNFQKQELNERIKSLGIDLEKLTKFPTSDIQTKYNNIKAQYSSFYNTIDGYYRDKSITNKKPSIGILKDYFEQDKTDEIKKIPQIQNAYQVYKNINTEINEIKNKIKDEIKYDINFKFNFTTQTIKNNKSTITLIKDADVAFNSLNNEIKNLPTIIPNKKDEIGKNIIALQTEIETINNKIKLKETEQYYEKINEENKVNLTDPNQPVESRLSGYFNRKLKEVNTPASQWELVPTPLSGPKAAAGGGGLMFKDIASELQKNSGDTDKVRRTLLMYDNDPVLSPKINELKYMDKVIFIAVTFLIRAVTLFIVQWGLNTRMLNDFVSAFIFYIFIYMTLFILWCFLVNATTNNVFFKVLFYYINLDSGTGPYARYKAYGRIIAHFVIFLLLIPVPFIVKDTVNTNLYSTAEYEQSVYEQRVKTYRYISQFTFFIWILTSVIAFSTP